MKLAKNTNTNKYAIQLIEEKQPSYGSIYTLSLVELETLKVYIETYLKTRFIRPSKSLASTLILYNKKPDSYFCLCVNYQKLNNMIIKN